MEFPHTDVIKILLAILCGTIIGFEREYHNKTAGLRTIILICMGSTIFTMVSLKMGGSDDRIAANIITGIGFIGAGVIFKNTYDVKGLTTAAVIWVTAAIGMIIGIDLYLMGVILSVVVLIILSFFSRIEDYIYVLNYKADFLITFVNTDVENLRKVEKLLTDDKLKFRIKQLSKTDNRLFTVIQVSGSKNKITRFTEELLAIEEVYQF
ncbi:MgtC/SapB family protein [Daejeonella oryzae]|uniref:MgtC/SapB family protein n=1 Tax=Daejeonella oryzae TaxID=1122943 RepID=UPI000402A775|nr:MgtC/SapB family protein [Daejeonella oryzae]